MMRCAVSCGCESIATWLEATSIVFARIVFAIVRCSSGRIARSSVATRYELGLDFHAAAVTLPRESGFYTDSLGAK